MPARGNGPAPKKRKALTMPITTQATYSEPKITRTESSAVIEYELTIDGIPSWDAIHLDVESGELLITDRTLSAALSSLLTIPAPILPVFIAEAQRLAEVAR